MTLTTRGSRLFPVDPFEVFGRPVESTPFGVDVREDADKLYVDANLPGFRKDQVEIVLDKSVLTISAKPADAVEAETPAVATQWLLRERQTRAVQRAFRLPATADGATVDAKLEDGVLRLTLTKREETKPRKIAVG